MVTDKEFKELKKRVDKMEEKLSQILQEPKLKKQQTSVKEIEINVSEIPFIKQLDSVLNKCLALLAYVFEKDHQHPGFTPDELEKIFREKFGLPVPLSTISSQLYKATGKYVTRSKITGNPIKYRYQILPRGQEVIKKKIEDLKQVS